ncbi:hypothetical protein [Vagococcus acidifermentans]|uniref:Uncharacterized protein n=1 Tax=Vagococcus acidifermentans TaxID=564710 RepID=A0A430B2F8_9ENTE|nr:hypothetical protein [Vagococcus acidifermentans]RSU14412.1 hypothetical protein CBF27_00030 [Vagococcus acidifermentans]
MEELELKVTNNNKEIKKLMEEINNQLPTIKDFMQEVIERNMPIIVTEEVKKQSNHTNDLGIEKLKEMKSSLNSIIQEVPNNIQNFLRGYKAEILIERDKELRKQPSDYDPRYGSETKFLSGYTIYTELEDFMKQEIGKVGKLLADFEYKVGHEWSNKGYTANFETQYSNDEFVYLFKDKNRVIDSVPLREFGDIFTKISKIIDDNIKLNKMISEKKAESLWDEI